MLVTPQRTISLKLVLELGAHDRIERRVDPTVES